MLYITTSQSAELTYHNHADPRSSSIVSSHHHPFTKQQDNLSNTTPPNRRRRPATRLLHPKPRSRAPPQRPRNIHPSKLLSRPLHLPNLHLNRLRIPRSTRPSPLQDQRHTPPHKHLRPNETRRRACGSQCYETGPGSGTPCAGVIRRNGAKREKQGERRERIDRCAMEESEGKGGDG